MYALAICLQQSSGVIFHLTDTDQVDLGGGLVINNQSIGVASRATGFQDVDGILGYVILSLIFLLFV